MGLLLWWFGVVVVGKTAFFFASHVLLSIALDFTRIANIKLRSSFRCLAERMH